MSALVSSAQWEEYASILNQFNDSVAKKKIIFRRFQRKITQFKEDISPTQYVDVELECLINYNYLRTWPATVVTESGELDKDSMQVLFNKRYLKSMGLLSQHSSLDFNPDYDRFIVDGQLKKAYGDTAVSQAGAEDILYSIILKTEDTDTGTTQIR